MCNPANTRCRPRQWRKPSSTLIKTKKKIATGSAVRQV
jgi:hypothetical protein